MEIKKVVVIGSGTMGSGIAAQLCNANIPVTLLDLTSKLLHQFTVSTQKGSIMTFGSASIDQKRYFGFLVIRNLFTNKCLEKQVPVSSVGGKKEKLS